MAFDPGMIANIAGAAGGGSQGGAMQGVNIDPNGMMGGKANFAGSATDIGGGLTNTPGNGGGNGGGGGEGPVHVETPADTAMKLAEPFKKYVSDAKAQAQMLMSDPYLKQMSQPAAPQPAAPAAQSVQKKKDEDEDKGPDFDEFKKMIDYVNDAKKQNELKKQGANAVPNGNVPLQTT